MAKQTKTFARAAFIVSAVLATVVSVCADSNDQAQKELEATHAQMVQVVNELNKSNPFVPPAAQSPQVVQYGQSGQSASPLQLSPEMAQKLEFAKKYLENPYVQKYMRAFADPAIQKDVTAIMNHPQRLAVLGWEAGWIVVMFIFKAWRLGKAKGLVNTIYTQLWTFALFTFGISFLIPRLVLGEVYAQLVRDMIQVLQR